MADVHGSPADAPQMPQASSAGSAPVPYQGGDQSPGASYGVGLGALVDAGSEVLNGIPPMPGLSESAAAHDIAAGLADAPYYPGAISPIDAMGDADAGGRDDVAATVAGAVAAAEARFREHQADTYGLGSTIGDIMTMPPSPLDPGVGSLGTTDPSGAFYDPPRNYGG